MSLRFRLVRIAWESKAFLDEVQCLFDILVILTLIQCGCFVAENVVYNSSCDGIVESFVRLPD